MNRNALLDYEHIKRNRKEYSFRKNIEDISKTILDSFDYVLAYHATKIYPFDDFSMGLLPSSEKLVKERAKKLIIPNFPNYKEAIEKVIDEMKLHIEPYIHYTISRSVFNDAYQYHRYGSELFALIAYKIHNEIYNVRCKEILASTGIPTTIHFKIPVSDLSDFELNDISRLICSDTDNWGSNHSKPIPKKQIIQFEKIPLPENKYNIPEYD